MCSPLSVSDVELGQRLEDVRGSPAILVPCLDGLFEVVVGIEVLKGLFGHHGDVLTAGDDADLVEI